MRIGVVCYPTYGGSGIVATQLGVALAERGHEIHFLSYTNPVRLLLFHPGIFFHQVEVPPYPLFKYPPYDLALASKMLEVCRDAQLDLLHVHYAIPHSISAYLTRQMLPGDGPRILTTLHGTDVVLVGADPSYRAVTRFGLAQSDVVVAVSRFLRNETIRLFGGPKNIRVIPNSVDVTAFHPSLRESARKRFAFGDEKILLHASNFRPLKRVRDALLVFERVARRMPARLLFLGDGPERAPLEEEVRRLRLRDRVVFLGTQDDVAPVFAAADLFVFPSEFESFGLAALEALSCGVPVIATRAGGLPEVVRDGQDGYLRDVGDVEALAEAATRLLSEETLWRRFSSRARRRAEGSFAASQVTDTYESLCRSMIGEDAEESE